MNFYIYYKYTFNAIIAQTYFLLQNPILIFEISINITIINIISYRLLYYYIILLTSRLKFDTILSYLGLWLSWLERNLDMVKIRGSSPLSPTKQYDVISYTEKIWN